MTGTFSSRLSPSLQFSGANSPVINLEAYIDVPVLKGLKAFRAKHPEINQPLMIQVSQLPAEKQTELGFLTLAQKEGTSQYNWVFALGNPRQPTTKAQKRHLQQLTHEVVKSVRDDAPGLTYQAAKKLLFINA